MNGFVYVLQSMRSGRYYIGSTNNLIHRYGRHASGRVRSTAQLRPVVMVGWREFPDMTAARKAEWALKQRKSRAYVERWLKEANAESVNSW
jgi:putative endonuclease